MSDDIEVPAKLTPRAIIRARRRASFSRFTSSFRRDKAGMLGLVIMLVFVALALLAPLLFDRSQLDVTQATAQPYLSPSLQYPLGTDDSGRNVLALVIWGARVSLLVGLCATLISMFIGTSIGIMSGHYRGFGGGALDRLTEWFLVIPSCRWRSCSRRCSARACS